MLEQVHPSQVSAEDIQLLFMADAVGPEYNSIKSQELIARLWDGTLQLYRAKGGVLLLEIIGRRLNIVRMAGSKLTLQFQSFAEELQHLARELGCVAIETNVYSSRLAKALTRIGAKQESVVMVLELSDG